MERKSYTITLYKKDARCKEGKMKIWYANFELTDKELTEELKNTFEVASRYMNPRNFSIVVEPFRSVKNLMTGKEVQIAADTPHCCDPSQERFWSM